MSHTEPEGLSRVMFLEDVLPKLGWGIYYKFMLGFACACQFANAAVSASLFFAIPMWTCENLSSKENILGLHTSYVLGRIFGGYVISCLSDVYGRKKFLNYSLIMVFLSTFTAAFGYNYYVILMSAFFIGSGIECNTTVVKVHLGEILSKERRGYFLVLCDIFWTFGYMFIFVFATFMKNSTVVEYRAIDMRLTTWRMMFAISGGLNLILACASALLEESPRYFLSRGKNYLAFLILKQFYAINNSTYAEAISVKESDLSNLILDYSLPLAHQNPNHANEFKRVMKINLQSIKLLFSAPFIKTCLIMLAVKTSLLILGTLDINILLAKQLNSHTIDNGMDVVYLDIAKNATMCSNSEYYKSLYMHFFVVAVSILLGQIIALILVDILGRSVILATSLGTFGGIFILIHFQNGFVATIILSTMAMMTYASAYTVASVVNIEAFPSAFRCTSIAVGNFFGLILQLIIVRCFYLLYGWYFYLIGSLYIGSAVASCFILELKRLPMNE